MKFEEEYAYEEASKFYLKAHKFYDVDNTPTQSNSMLIKWADLQILQKSFDQASVVKMIQAYEKVANKYL